MTRRLRALLAPLIPVRIVLPWLLFWKGPGRGLSGYRGWARSVRDKAPLDAEGRPLPWIAYAASTLLAERLGPAHTVLELGSGYSTLFLMARAGRVVSIEHDPYWLAWARGRVADNVELVAADGASAATYVAAIRSRPERFDVVVVDGVHRIEAFSAVLEKLSAGGVVLLDDSQRARLASCYEAGRAAGLRHLDFEGHKPASVDVHRCTLFYRDGNCLGI